jgi:serine/threonine-protein kinase
MAPGTRLGRYEILGILGTGGMATVYLGRAHAVGGFQRLVAIKYLHPHLLRDEEFIQMFLDEGRLAARIHHPNVVATVDLEQNDLGIYIVSEYIEGDQLLGLYKKARARDERIPAPVTVRIMLDVLSGLHAAHELTDDDGKPLQIVHRDISPHNVLVGSDGISRLTDFGIAKAEERISTTREGIVKGKLSYMAPEQADDNPVDRRADVFSAATVLWECLVGRRLFPGRTDRDVLEGLMNKPIPRLKDNVVTLPDALDEVLARALERDPDKRFATAAEFADALEQAAAPLQVATARAVAQYVRENAASKIDAEHQQRRAMTTRDLPVYRPQTGSQVRAIVPSTDPPPAAEYDEEAPTRVQSPPEPIVAMTDPAPQPALRVPSIAPPTVSGVIAARPQPARAPAPPPPTRARKSWPIALVVLFGALIGYGVWALHQRNATPAASTVLPTQRVTVRAEPAVLPIAPVPAPPPALPSPPAPTAATTANENPARTATPPAPTVRARRSNSGDETRPTRPRPPAPSSLPTSI